MRKVLPTAAAATLSLTAIYDLAYAGLFAILAAILFAIGVLGYVVREPERLATIVQQVASQVPPLTELVRTGLERTASARRRAPAPARWRGAEPGG